ncbi:Uncharacterised protein [Bordetella pertussis]|nr:Uncharacterised protein [Bordetella pertussis]
MRGAVVGAHAQQHVAYPGHPGRPCQQRLGQLARQAAAALRGYNVNTPDFSLVTLFHCVPARHAADPGQGAVHEGAQQHVTLARGKAGAPLRDCVNAFFFVTGPEGFGRLAQGGQANALKNSAASSGVKGRMVERFTSGSAAYAQGGGRVAPNIMKIREKRGCFAAQEPQMFGFRRKDTQQYDQEAQDAFVERVAAAARDFVAAVPAGAGLDYSPASIAALDAVLEQAHLGALALDPVQRVGAAAYLYEVARRRHGGLYEVCDDDDPVVLVTGEPEFDVCLCAIAKVERRIDAGPQEDLRPFFGRYEQAVAARRPDIIR